MILVFILNKFKLKDKKSQKNTVEAEGRDMKKKDE
jgi:hypothetical protein